MSEHHDSRDYIHPETGEVYVPKEDLENCEAALRRERRKVKAYERGEKKERLAYKERVQVLEAIEYWAKLTGHEKANVNASDRFDMVVARRKEGYGFKFDPEDPAPTIDLAIEGLAANPYVGPQGRQCHNGSGSKRHDRLGIALGSGEDLERFARLGYLARRES